MGIFKFLEDNRNFKKVDVLEYFTTDVSRYFKLIIYFADGSELHAREYIGENERNYSFHWQRKHELICRWDNAPHYKNLKTFPHHIHRPEGVFESQPVTLIEVLDSIESTF